LQKALCEKNILAKLVSENHKTKIQFKNKQLLFYVSCILVKFQVRIRKKTLASQITLFCAPVPAQLQLK